MNSSGLLLNFNATKFFCSNLISIQERQNFDSLQTGQCHRFPSVRMYTLIQAITLIGALTFFSNSEWESQIRPKISANLLNSISCN